MNQANVQKNILQAPRGTRDFYPDLMARLQWLFNQWRQISLMHGFEEYEGPIFEHLDLYQIKSGEGIVSELFSFEDRGGRNLAIRPELTPTLARMVAARANALPKPVKWFSIPRMCRAERPQKGRLREFFQWNIDIVGSDDVLADAECIFVACDFLRRVGLGPDKVELRVNSRPLVGTLLTQAGIGADRHELFFTIMDKYEKLEGPQFATYAREQGLSETDFNALLSILHVPNFSAVAAMATTDECVAEVKKIEQLQSYLNYFGLSEYFQYKPTVVRGLAYYTGIVWEIFDRGAQMRAVAGGGRYDNLIRMFGGPAMPAVGFGMGDVVIMDLLEEAGKLPAITPHHPPDFFVIDAEADLFPLAMQMVAQLRQKDIVADYSPRRQAIGKQIKYASGRSARFAVILGSETRDQNLVTIKNLKTGEQSQMSVVEFSNNPRHLLQ